MKLFNQKEKEWYLFGDETIEDGMVCRCYKFLPGELVSNIFASIEETISWLMLANSSIKFIHLNNGSYCIVKSRNRTYIDKYKNNLTSIVGVLHTSGCTEKVHPPINWLNDFAENEGEIFFHRDEDGCMVEMFLKSKQGAFRYTTYEKFVELVNKFIGQVK